MALASAPVPPKMRTDCKALLAILAGGIERATSPGRVLARVWTRIGHALDGDTSQLADRQLLVWMPAHQSTRAIGTSRGSDGRLLSALDWRANRLVDGLAKLVALRRLPSGSTVATLRSAKLAARHAAQKLGQVTHAANNGVHHMRDAAPRRTGTWACASSGSAGHEVQTPVAEAALAATVEATPACGTTGGGALQPGDRQWWQVCAPTPVPDERKRARSEPPAGRCCTASAASRQAAARRDATRRRAADADLLASHLTRAAPVVVERPASPGPSRFALLRARIAARRGDAA